MSVCVCVCTYLFNIFLDARRSRNIIQIVWSIWCVLTALRVSIAWCGVDVDCDSDSGSKRVDIILFGFSVTQQQQQQQNLCRQGKFINKIDVFFGEIKIKFIIKLECIEINTNRGSSSSDAGSGSIGNYARTQESHKTWERVNGQWERAAHYEGSPTHSLRPPSFSFQTSSALALSLAFGCAASALLLFVGVNDVRYQFSFMTRNNNKYKREGEEEAAAL